MWPKEDIPNEASVFMRLHRNLIFTGEIGPNVFRDQEGGMSVDWDKYSSASETRARGRTPADNAVISMGVASIRAIEALVVEHDPVQENSFDQKGNPLKPNRAHSQVIGEKDTQRRLMLSRIWKWEIRLD